MKKISGVGVRSLKIIWFVEEKTEAVTEFQSLEAIWINELANTFVRFVSN